jgi:hypothetical protein
VVCYVMLLLWIFGSPLDKFSTFEGLGGFGKFWGGSGGLVVAACQFLAHGHDRTMEGASPPQRAKTGHAGDPGCAPTFFGTTEVVP